MVTGGREPQAPLNRQANPASSSCMLGEPRRESWSECPRPRVGGSQCQIALYHRPLLNRLMGEIAERQDRPDQAAEYYGRLVELWADCDPALVPEREEVAARLAALRR